MLILKFLAKLVRILRSGVSPNQIAGGFILGMIIGLTPIWNLHNLLIIFLIILLRVNIAAAIFSFLLFSGVAYLADPVFHDLGYYVLTQIPALQDLWITMYNTPILAFSNFNNTVVMGSLVASIVLLIPMFFLMKAAIISYRTNVEDRMNQWKIVKSLKGTTAYSIYERVRNGYRKFRSLGE